jgi:hypothetical protein
VANSPTGGGIFLPNGYLNNFNSASATGQVDAYGLTYPSGSTLGKMIELGDNEAANLAAPGTPANSLFGGAYQIVQLDSSATAANCIAGNAAYIKLNLNGVTAGTLPETGFSTITVTDYAHLDSSSLPAGVFINPATLNGFANTPTPGNFIIIFVGAGRAKVNIGTAASTSLYAIVNAGDAAGGFSTAAGTTPSTTTVGLAVTTPAASSSCVMYSENIIYRLRP